MESVASSQLDEVRDMASRHSVRRVHDRRGRAAGSPGRGLLVEVRSVVRAAPPGAAVRSALRRRMVRLAVGLGRREPHGVFDQETAGGGESCLRAAPARRSGGVRVLRDERGVRVRRSGGPRSGSCTVGSSGKALPRARRGGRPSPVFSGLQGRCGAPGAFPDAHEHGGGACRRDDRFGGAIEPRPTGEGRRGVRSARPLAQEKLELSRGQATGASFRERRPGGRDRNDGLEAPPGDSGEEGPIQSPGGQLPDRDY